MKPLSLPVDVTVRDDYAGYRTCTVAGLRARCTYSEEVAVQRLLEKLVAARHVAVTCDVAKKAQVGHDCRGRFTRWQIVAAAKGQA